MKTNWIERHLNWTYGIALILGLIAFLWFVFTDSPTGYIGFIIYITIIYLVGYYVAWRKNNWAIYHPPMLIIFPPLFAIVALCSRNIRKNKQEIK